MTPAAIAALMTAAAALIGALYAISKRRPEMAQVLVTSASAVVVMQRDMLAETDRRNEEFKDRIRQLEEHQAAQDTVIQDMMDEMRALAESRDKVVKELEIVTRERDVLLEANQEMKATNRDLERRVADLEAQVPRWNGGVPVDGGESGEDGSV